MPELTPMSDFEARFERRLQDYAAVTVQPVDADTVAHATAGATGLVRRSRTAPVAQLRSLLVAAAIVVSLVVGALIAGGGRRVEAPTILGRNGSIAYTAYDAGNWRVSRLHLMDADGSNDREIADGGCGGFSADGSKLSYFTGSPGTSDASDTIELVIAQSDGSDARVVPGKPFPIRVSLSPDFEHIWWITEAGRDTTSGVVVQGNEVWVANLDGTSPIRVAPKSDRPGEFYESVVWSPDGRHLAFAGLIGSSLGGGVQRTAVYVAGSDGSSFRKLTTRLGTDAATIAWSPDGRHLAFDGLPDGAPFPTDEASHDAGPLPTVLDGVVPAGTPVLQSDLFVIGADGAGERSITSTPTVDEFGPAWSPDGTRLAYEGYPPLAGENAARMATVRVADGSPVGPPAIGPANNGFTWSPDGTKLLLLRTSDTDASIHVVDPDFATAPVSLLESDAPISCFSWQRLEP